MSQGALVLGTVCFLTFVISAVCSYLLIFTADKLHIVANPTADRWHKRATPFFGGIAMYTAFAIGLVGYYLVADTLKLHNQASLETFQFRMFVILGSATGMFALGLIDDFVNCKPHTKFLWQVIFALTVAIFGVKVEIIQNDFIAVFITVLWIVGITNAINLLDNMDGLAGGVSLIACLSFAAMAYGANRPFLFVASVVLASAIMGFLIFNVNPAKMFMGDSGSLMLGFSISVFALLGSWEIASNAVAALLGPLLILSIPIFDTTLVSINRTLSGKRVSEGGRDHSSHRLVALGLSERRAVFYLLLGSALLSGFAIAGFKLQTHYLVLFSFLAVVGLTLFGIYLSELNVYEKKDRYKLLEALRQRSRVVDALVIYKKPVFEFIVDCVFLGAALLLALLIQNDGNPSVEKLEVFFKVFPIILIAKLLAFALIDPYHSDLRHIGFQEMIRLVKAVVTASFAAYLALVLTDNASAIPKSTLIIDAMVSLLLLSGYRIAIRAANEHIFAVSKKSKNVVIIGANDFGVAFVRYLRSSRSKEFNPIGFLDDRKKLHGRRIAGISVLGAPTDIEKVLANFQVDEIIHMNTAADSSSFEVVQEACLAHDVKIKRAFSGLYPVRGGKKLDRDEASQEDLEVSASS